MCVCHFVSSPTAFSFFMFTIYAVFAGFLVMFRDKIGNAASSSAATEEGEGETFRDEGDVEESATF